MLNAYPALSMGYATYGGFNRNQTPVRTDNTQNELVVTRKRKPKYRRRTTFKQRLLRNIPAKHFITNDSQTTKAPMTHNTIYTCNLTAGIVQGTSDQTRLGDAVYLAAVKINALYTSPSATSSSCQLRLIVGWGQPEYNLSATFGSGLALTEIFQTGTGGNWTNTAIVNPKAFTVLDDRLITVNNNIASVSEIQEAIYTVQIDSDFNYKANASLYGKTRNLYFVAIACISGGTPGTTNAGQINASTDLIFKDQ